MPLNNAQQKMANQMTNGSLFALYLLKKLPMGWIAGLRVREINDKKSITSVPYKFLTQNPFKSTYFAVQSMAAELSTAAACLIAVQGHAPSVAYIIVDMKASFVKKATGRTYFTCEDNQNAFEAVEACIASGEAKTATFKTTGRLKDGTVVSEFSFTWSFKQRKS